jgi:hypothetical protein
MGNSYAKVVCGFVLSEIAEIKKIQKENFIEEKLYILGKEFKINELKYPSEWFKDTKLQVYSIDDDGESIDLSKFIVGFLLYAAQGSEYCEIKNIIQMNDFFYHDVIDELNNFAKNIGVGIDNPVFSKLHLICQYES